MVYLIKRENEEEKGKKGNVNTWREILREKIKYKNVLKNKSKKKGIKKKAKKCCNDIVEELCFMTIPTYIFFKSAFAR